MMMIGFAKCENVADRLEAVGYCERLVSIGLPWKTGVVFDFQACRCHESAPFLGVNQLGF